jgi:hypothetical protein
MAGFGGAQEGAGRPKGSQSKIGREIREAIHQAFNELGGVSYLKAMAEREPRAFSALLAKIVPQELEVDVRFDRLDEGEISTRILAFAAITQTKPADAISNDHEFIGSSEDIHAGAGFITDQRSEDRGTEAAGGTAAEGEGKVSVLAISGNGSAKA